MKTLLTLQARVFMKVSMRSYFSLSVSLSLSVSVSVSTLRGDCQWTGLLVDY